MHLYYYCYFSQNKVALRKPKQSGRQYLNNHRITKYQTMDLSISIEDKLLIESKDAVNNINMVGGI